MSDPKLDPTGFLGIAASIWDQFRTIGLPALAGAGVRVAISPRKGTPLQVITQIVVGTVAAIYIGPVVAEALTDHTSLSPKSENGIVFVCGLMALELIKAAQERISIFGETGKLSGNKSKTG